MVTIIFLCDPSTSIAIERNIHTEYHDMKSNENRTVYGFVLYLGTGREVIKMVDNQHHCKHIHIIVTRPSNIHLWFRNIFCLSCLLQFFLFSLLPFILYFFFLHSFFFFLSFHSHFFPSILATNLWFLCKRCDAPIVNNSHFK